MLTRMLSVYRTARPSTSLQSFPEGRARGLYTGYPFPHPLPSIVYGALCSKRHFRGNFMIIFISLLKHIVWSMKISENFVTNFFSHSDVINMQIRSDAIIQCHKLSQKGNRKM